MGGGKGPHKVLLAVCLSVKKKNIALKKKGRCFQMGNRPPNLGKKSRTKLNHHSFLGGQFASLASALKELALRKRHAGRDRHLPYGLARALSVAQCKPRGAEKKRAKRSTPLHGLPGWFVRKKRYNRISKKASPCLGQGREGKTELKAGESERKKVGANHSAKGGPRRRLRKKGKTVSWRSN